MYLFLRISLLLAACYGGVQLTHFHLNFDQLCHLTRPVFRMTLLKDVMYQLQQKYNVHSGYAVQYLGLAIQETPTLTQIVLITTTLLWRTDLLSSLVRKTSVLLKPRQAQCYPVKVGSINLNKTMPWCCLDACHQRQTTLEFGPTCTRRRHPTSKKV